MIVRLYACLHAWVAREMSQSARISFTLRRGLVEGSYTFSCLVREGILFATHFFLKSALNHFFFHFRGFWGILFYLAKVRPPGRKFCYFPEVLHFLSIRLDYWSLIIICFDALTIRAQLIMPYHMYQGVLFIRQFTCIFILSYRKV